MTLIDARDTFAARRAETKAERIYHRRASDRDMAVDWMVEKLRRKGHSTAEIATTLRTWAKVYARIAEEAAEGQHR